MLHFVFTHISRVRTERYGGHLVDVHGNIVKERQGVRDLMNQYPIIDRHLQGTEFQVTHGVWSGTKGRQGRSKYDGLVVDGGPLTHPVLDHVVGVERGALANSANHKNKNM
jgi:hypothetical protein